MTDTRHHDQAFWEARWHATVWEGQDEAGRWTPIAPCSAEPLVVLSAWNPGGGRLPLAVNLARDALLLAELRALGLSPVRARGRSPDHAWCEEGWRIADLPARTAQLLRRYGQLAGWVTGPAGPRYAWSVPAG